MKLKQPSRLAILNEIGQNFQGVAQWGGLGPWSSRSSVDWAFMVNSVKYATRAEALIELLEVNDCGSVGGFDAGQREAFLSPSPSLFERFEWLVNKYNTPKQLKITCATFDVLKEVFNPTK